MTIQITRDPIDLAAALRTLDDPVSGAVVTFTGTVRNRSQGRRVLQLDYTAYEEMLPVFLAELAEEARRRFHLNRAVVVVRLGIIRPGEASVFLGTGSPHRAEAFDACRYLIEELKKSAPVWKKETYTDGAAWIEGDTVTGI